MNHAHHRDHRLRMMPPSAFTGLGGGLLALLLIVGCSSRDLPTQYGRERSPPLETSVNGVDILSSMFTAAGHNVSSRRVVMTRAMESVDTIVWFPKDYDAPSQEFCQWADKWLSEGISRTLIYVGADFDASLIYWHKMAARAESEDQKEYQARATAASIGARVGRHEHVKKEEEKKQGKEQDEKDAAGNAKDEDQDKDKSGGENKRGERKVRGKKRPGKKSKDEKDPDDRDPLRCEWFRIEPSEELYYSSTSVPGAMPETVLELSGPWAAGIDAAKTELQLHEWLEPHANAERLLNLGKFPFVSRFEEDRWPDSRIILVANGSFLLNLPLVNHEHRKLAGKLVAAVGSPGKVVFLSSGPGGPPIDPEETDRSIWQVFGAWPLNAILLQLAVIGVIFCFARWPIFGRPRQPPPESISDFGKHVAAVGELLRRTHDRAFARAQLPAAPSSPSEPVAPAEKPG